MKNETLKPYAELRQFDELLRAGLATSPDVIISELVDCAAEHGLLEKLLLQLRDTRRKRRPLNFYE